MDLEFTSAFILLARAGVILNHGATAVILLLLAATWLLLTTAALIENRPSLHREG